MRAFVVLLASFVSLVLTAAAVFFAVMLLAGPHGGVLPASLHPATLILGWILVLVIHSGACCPLGLASAIPHFALDSAALGRCPGELPDVPEIAWAITGISKETGWKPRNCTAGE